MAEARSAPPGRARLRKSVLTESPDEHTGQYRKPRVGRHRPGPLSLENFEGSGADWLDRYKPYINDGATIVTNPHKVYGPEANDLVLQLRKQQVDRVLLAGMSANLCVESHLRELLEQGFEVYVVKDATAGAITPDLGDGYQAALTNFVFLASGVFTTE